jgi:hypothetical protein
MAGCSCHEGKSAAENAAGLFLCVKTHQCFVTHIVEKVLPILFWLGIIGSFIVAFKVADAISVFSGFFVTTLSFLVVLVTNIACVLITFYVIYLLKKIKDTLKEKDSESGCGCGCGDETEVVKKEVAAPKKRGRKPKPKV